MNPILNMIFSIIIMLLLTMVSRKLLDNEHELLFFLIFNIAGFIFEYLICGLRGPYLVFQLILWLFSHYCEFILSEMKSAFERFFYLIFNFLDSSKTNGSLPRMRHDNSFKFMLFHRLMDSFF